MDRQEGKEAGAQTPAPQNRPNLSSVEIEKSQISQPESSTKNAALSYIGQGFKVIPIHNGATQQTEEGARTVCTCHRRYACPQPGKHPLTKKGVRDASNDPEVVEAWFDKWEMANVAIATGKASGIVVLDVDPRNGGDKSYELLRPLLPATLCARTGGGGLHLYFALSEEDSLKGIPAKPWTGIDFKANGGYVIAPPSGHFSGQAYTWLTTLPPAPFSEIYDLIPKQDKSARREEGNGHGEVTGSPSQLEYAKRSLDHAVATVQMAFIGNRNNALNKEAYGMGGFIAQGLLDHNTVYQQLRSAAIACGLPENEIDSTLERSLQQGVAKPRSVPDDLPKIGEVERISLPQEAIVLSVVKEGEIEVAEYVIKMYNRLLYDKERQELVEYDEGIGIWREVDDGEVEAKIETLHGAWVSDIVSEFPKVLSITDRFSTAVVKRIKSKCHKPKFFSLGIGEGLPFKDGVYRLGEGLLSHSPDNRFRHTLDCRYEESAECPRWLEVLNRILPDPQSFLMFQEALGATLLRLSTAFERGIVLHGPGSNGKSLVCNVIRGIMPPNTVVFIPPHTFGNRFSIAPMKDAWANIVTEINRDEMVATETLKACISGDPIQVEEKYKIPYSIIPRAAQWFACNTLPVVTDHTEGLWRKLAVIPFNVVIPIKEQDKELWKKLVAEERSGILQWGIRGAERLVRQNEFTHSALAAKATLAWKKASNVVAQFVDDEYTVVKGGKPLENWTSATDIYNEYKQWSAMNGFRALNSTNFGTRLGSLGVERKHTKKGRYWSLAKK